MKRILEIIVKIEDRNDGTSLGCFEIEQLCKEVKQIIGGMTDGNKN